MKLSRYHFVLISLLGLLVMINVAILKNQPVKVKVDAYSKEALLGAEIADTNKANTSIIPIEEKEIEVIPLKNQISILHFGDAMFDRNVRKRMIAGADPFSSLRESDIMHNYEIRMLNLEGPIIEMDRSKCQQKAYNFQFASTTAKMLKNEGFTVVTIANNHIFDCYKIGASSTIKYLNESNINVVGAPLSNPTYEIIRTAIGASVAILGIDTTINPYPGEKTFSLIKELKEQSDIVLVTMHSGVEYAERATAEQKKLAHTLIDSGADIIIGHHPHVVENMELYKNKIIFYSLGNFIFDQIGEKENEGVGVGFKIIDNDTQIFLYPYNIINSVPTFKNKVDTIDWCNTYYKNSGVIDNEGCLLKI